MESLDFLSFRKLIAKIKKEKLFDAVRPELLLCAEGRCAKSLNQILSLTKPEAYEEICIEAYEFCGTGAKKPGNVVRSIVEKTGNGSGGKTGNYDAPRIYAEQLYYYFLFSSLCGSTLYGVHISKKLYRKHFYDQHEKFLRHLGIPRPKHLPMIKAVTLGGLSISLSADDDLVPFEPAERNPKNALIDADGTPCVYSAMHWRSRLSGRYGRDDEWRKLHHWAFDSSKQVKIMLISGPGGSGKTRLAADFVDELVDAKEWKGGFLPRQLHTLNRPFDGSGAGVIFIIDYPEEKTAEVLAILQDALEQRHFKKPIRIILASRENRERWLKKLNRTHADRFEEISLDFDYYLSKQNAITISQDVACTYAQLLERPEPVFTGVDVWLDRDPAHRLPLYIVAASVHALLSPDNAFQLSGRDVLNALGLF